MTNTINTNNMNNNLNDNTNTDLIRSSDNLGILNGIQEYYNENVNKSVAQDNISNIVKLTRERLKLGGNPELVDEIQESNNYIDKLKQTPFNHFLDIKRLDETKELNNKQIEDYQNISQYNSSQNLIKQGTKDVIISYLDKDNQKQELELFGNETITEDTDNIYILQQIMIIINKQQ